MLLPLVCIVSGIINKLARLRSAQSFLAYLKYYNLRLPLGLVQVVVSFLDLGKLRDEDGVVVVERFGVGHLRRRPAGKNGCLVSSGSFTHHGLTHAAVADSCVSAEL